MTLYDLSLSWNELDRQTQYIVVYCANAKKVWQGKIIDIPFRIMNERIKGLYIDKYGILIARIPYYIIGE